MMAEKRRIPPRLKKNRRKKMAGYLPLVLFFCAALLLISSTVGSVRATLTYVSEYYDARVRMYEIGVSLVENGSVVSHRDYADNGNWSSATGVLLEHIPESEFKVGVEYPEVLNVLNSGEIDQYVRVRVFKTWERKEDGQWKKATDLSPDMIELHFVTDGWYVDTAACTRERTVLYYKQILEPGDSSAIFADTLRISSDILTRVKPVVEQSVNGSRIVTTYCYDDVRFVIEAEVDAVQTHNAVDAIKSAWGVDANMSGTTINSVG